MRARIVLAAILAAVLSTPASAQCTSIPNTLSNGTTADASKVMGNFTYLGGCAASVANPKFTGGVGIGTWTANVTALDVDGSDMLGVGVAAGTSVGFYLNGNGTMTAANNYQRFSMGYGLYWNNTALNYTIADQTYNQATFSDENGNFVWTLHSGALATPETYAQWHAFDRMILTAGGSLGIGTGSPGYLLQVNGTAGGAGQWQVSSDARLKKNIRRIDHAMALIEKIDGVRFDWRTPDERAVGKSLNLPIGEPQVGFIAQNLKKALPEAVGTGNDPDKIMSVAEPKVVPVLVEAVKELKADNDRLAAALARRSAEAAHARRDLAALKARDASSDLELQAMASRLARLERRVGISDATDNTRSAIRRRPSAD